jgi:tRNA dimethylallyltransferase
MIGGMKTDKTIVIVGPTGSGKTGAGIALAKLVGGEVISADSRAIYCGMDIGTAKPDVDEMGGVVHWGIDLVEPDERFTAADFKEYALLKIQEIRGRGHIPIIVGGTGLYVDAVVYDYQFDDVVKKTQKDRTKVNKTFIQVGIKWNREELRMRLTQRAYKMFDSAIVEETKELAEKYDWDLQSMRSNIYPIVWQMMNGEIEREEAMRLFIKDDMGLAKRQMTWFKRNPQIAWMPLDEVVPYIVGELAK